MKILVFTEGTILMFGAAKGLSPEERVTLSKEAGIQREERNIAYESGNQPPSVETNSVYDFANHIPTGNAVEKIMSWRRQGAIINYLTSRRIKSEIDLIRTVLKKYKFPDYQNLYFRRQGEDYKDVAERILPDILIEDDCESIGGEKEMTYPHIREDLKTKIKSIAVKEFGGIDHLTDDLQELLSQ